MAARRVSRKVAAGAAPEYGLCMGCAQLVTLYLEDDLRRSAQAGQHNFISLVTDVLGAADYDWTFAPIADLPHHPGGPSLTHMAAPPPGGLVFRRVYAYPFWAIEATSERWHWDVAQARFDPESVDLVEARTFAARWRNRLYPNVNIGDDGFIFVPLQGRIQERRSFQRCTPLQMISRAARAFPDREIRITLHPKEKYSLGDLAALRKIAVQKPNVTLSDAPADQLLPRCHAVVTQNSSLAYFGYLLEKPAVLFASIDFHHIALRPSQMDQTVTHRPDLDAYVYWFWQQNSINAGRDIAHNQIAHRLHTFGWL